MNIAQKDSLAEDLSNRLFDTLLQDNDDEGRICRDIPDDACDEQPRAFSAQLLAQTLTKFGDALVNPRLVLTWMLSSLGSPSVFIALLVPVRESFSLLPQLFIAKFLRERPLRKTFWVLGAIGQAMALAGMLPAIALLDGTLLGLTVVLLLAFFSICRAVCSITSKDVLGKTISKSRRGRLNGLAASTAGGATLLTAVTLIFYSPGATAGSEMVFIALIGTAVALWLTSAVVFAAVPEVPGATEGGGNAIREAIRSLDMLRSDAVLRNFIIARGLMVAAAIAVPYIVFLIQRQSDAGFASLGWLMLAEGMAALLSGPFWGKWSDTASHRVMAIAGGGAALLIAAVVVLQLTTASLLGTAPVAGALLFTIAVCHQGIRVGRKTYLVDIASSDNRAQYTAVSNTVIGVIVAATGVFGIVDAMYGTTVVLVLLGAISLVASIFALRLKPA